MQAHNRLRAPCENIMPRTLGSGRCTWPTIWPAGTSAAELLQPLVEGSLLDPMS
ncbi:MAG: hypothetical protein ACPIOQ_79850 [Promethearchaeia archaeon]